MTDSREQRTGGAAVAVATRDDIDEVCDGDLIVDDVLVEDVSIDGMCGVY